MSSVASSDMAPASTSKPCTTPQPSHAVPHAAISPSRAASPSDTSNPASDTTSSSTSPVVGNHMRDSNRYVSPPPLSSRTTPPPSSQPQRRQMLSTSSPIMRIETPAYSVLSSPPGSQLHAINVKHEPDVVNSYLVPSTQEMAEASASGLRTMLQTCMAENSRLEATIGEVRMSAAHYKLQYQLLGIETQESKSRMEVEHEMTRREVEALRMSDQAREARHRHGQGSQAISQYTADLKAYCEAMDSENRLLSRRLEKAKKIIMNKDEALESVLDDNRKYIKRIRENREHLNRLKSPGGIYAPTPRQAPPIFPVTPQQHVRSTPKQTPRSVSQHHHHLQRELDKNQDPFSALLEADRVLQGKSQRQHVRNVQSMSSLPTTPVRSTAPEYSHLLPSVQFVPQSEPRYRTAYPSHSAPRSRKSRDSTISVSDAEEIVEYNRSASQQERGERNDVEITPSQASRSASSMLKRDASGSVEILASPIPGKNSRPSSSHGVLPLEKSGLLQAKIFGTVTKPSTVEKRKRVDEPEEYAQKTRVGEGVGLGIGGW